MQSDFLTSIKNSKVVPAGGVVILGLSGGPDSTCLFDVLQKLKKELNFLMICAHLNHQIRGDEAEKDALYAKKLSEQAGVDFFSKSVDIKKYAAEHKLTAEEAGRECRYDFFAEIAEKLISKGTYKKPEISIAIAHNSDDVVETVLMRIIRGTGVYGLNGIEPIGKTKGGLRIIRPLIFSSRPDIECYNAENGLAPRIDHTNSENDYTRNKIRNELLPHIRADYNPQLNEAILRLSELARIDNSYLDEIAMNITRNQNSASKDRISLPIAVIENLHLAIKTRLIRRLAYELGLVQDLTHKHIKDILALIESARTNTRLDLPHGYIAGVDYQEFYISKNTEKISSFCQSQYSIIFKEITRETYDKESLNDRKEGTDKLFLDIDKLKQSGLLAYEDDLFLRSRQAGDVFSPRKLNGVKKLKDVYIDMKIPRNLRETIPLLVFKNEVLWVFGYRKSKSFCVDASSKAILEISLARE
jgi:tRNA(Ile)-lysidine synthase